MADFYPAFAAQLDALQAPVGHLFIACLGGGADSQTVLDLLDRYRHQNPQYRYLAIHLDHQFHPDSGAWAQVLQADCEARQFPFLLEVLAVAQGPAVNKEAAGRDARYQRLQQLAQQHGAAVAPVATLLLGHHANDQIETVLLQLKRGAGPKGLSAMAAHSHWQQCRWLRPLLAIRKAEIYAYAQQHQLRWVEDETNYDTGIERNFLRHQVVPLLEQRWPHFARAVLRSSALCAEQQQLLDQLLAQQLQQHQRTSDGALRVDSLAAESEPLQRALLRLWLQQQQQPMPSQAQLAQIMSQFLHTDNNARPLYRCAHYILRRSRDRYLILEAVP